MVAFGLDMGCIRLAILGLLPSLQDPGPNLILSEYQDRIRIGTIDSFDTPPIVLTVLLILSR